MQERDQDLQKFRSGLKKKNEMLRLSASRAVKDLPASLEAAQGELDVVQKSTNQTLNSGRYSRSETQLSVIQSNLNSFCVEQDDAEDYGKWNLGCELGDTNRVFCGIKGIPSFFGEEAGEEDQREWIGQEREDENVMKMYTKIFKTVLDSTVNLAGDEAADIAAAGGGSGEEDHDFSDHESAVVLQRLRPTGRVLDEGIESGAREAVAGDRVGSKANNGALKDRAEREGGATRFRFRCDERELDLRNEGRGNVFPLSNGLRGNEFPSSNGPPFLNLQDNGPRFSGESHENSI